MKASAILINHIKQCEGLRLKAYRCPAGVPTIGYGSTKGVRMGMVITAAEAEGRLLCDLEQFENYVNSLNVCKTQGQFDALVDFCFNLGNWRLASSTLLKYIKAKMPTSEIQKQFLIWNKSGGKVLRGLTIRREWEAKRYGE
jgi:lysozyme